jgi:hypothetical protein
LLQPHDKRAAALLPKDLDRGLVSRQRETNDIMVRRQRRGSIDIDEKLGKIQPDNYKDC